MPVLPPVIMITLPDWSGTSSAVNLGVGGKVWSITLSKMPMFLGGEVNRVVMVMEDCLEHGRNQVLNLHTPEKAISRTERHLHNRCRQG